ncbi:MAG: hypothetical protein ABR507_07415, partial [Actinomycetota bacterium]
LEQKPGKLTFELKGQRLRAIYHMIETKSGDWLAVLSDDKRDAPDPMPDLDPMLCGQETEAFDDNAWAFEPIIKGTRLFAVCSDSTRLMNGDEDVTVGYKELSSVGKNLVAIDAIVDAVASGPAGRTTLCAFDLIYLDGKSLMKSPYDERRHLLEQIVVPSERLQLVVAAQAEGKAFAQTAFAQGFETIVAKKLDSSYASGKSAFWRLIRS